MSHGGAGIVLALAATLVLGGCNDNLTRDLAEKILNENRSHSCQATLSFQENGFEKAQSDGAIKDLGSSQVDRGMRYLVTDIPGEQDRWIVPKFWTEFGYARVQREKKYRCMNGKSKVTAIIDGPMDSMKEVEYIEWVLLPPELEPIRSYIYVAYNKKAGFQHTDQGWRIAR